MNRRVTLRVFGREDARRQWLADQMQAGKHVDVQRATVADEGGITIARVVQSTHDYASLKGLSLSEVIEHKTFMPPDGWWVFSACLVRRGAA